MSLITKYFTIKHVTIFLIIILALYIKGSTTFNLLKEDGIVENFQVMILGINALLSLACLSLFKNKTKTTIFSFLSLGIFFLLVEEISWGQRIIGFETPEQIIAINAQEEFNFHNLSIILPHLETMMNATLMFLGVSTFILHYKIEEIPKELRSIIPNKDCALSLIICSLSWVIIKLDIYSIGGTVSNLFMQEVYELVFYLILFSYLFNIRKIHKGNKQS